MDVLVVEDERLIAFMISRLLADLGHRVVGCFPSGESALEFLAGAHPDFVLMDIKLEGVLDGIETAERIDELWHIPLAFASAYVDEATRARAKAAHPVAIIKKPLRKEDLKAALAGAGTA
jgi:CheY-like chemotaxis protein